MIDHVTLWRPEDALVIDIHTPTGMGFGRDVGGLGKSLEVDGRVRLN